MRRPRLWLHEAIDIFPFIARADHGARSLAPPCPNPPQDRLQSDAVLVFGPEFNLGTRVGVLELPDAAREGLGKAA